MFSKKPYVVKKHLIATILTLLARKKHTLENENLSYIVKKEKYKLEC